MSKQRKIENVKLKTIHRFLSLEFETWNLFVI